VRGSEREGTEKGQRDRFVVDLGDSFIVSVSMSMSMSVSVSVSVSVSMFLSVSVSVSVSTSASAFTSASMSVFVRRKACLPPDMLRQDRFCGWKFKPKSASSILRALSCRFCRLQLSNPSKLVISKKSKSRSRYLYRMPGGFSIDE